MGSEVTQRQRKPLCSLGAQRVGSGWTPSRTVVPGQQLHFCSCHCPPCPWEGRSVDNSTTPASAQGPKCGQNPPEGPPMTSVLWPPDPLSLGPAHFQPETSQVPARSRDTFEMLSTRVFLAGTFRAQSGNLLTRSCDVHDCPLGFALLGDVPPWVVGLYLSVHVKRILISAFWTRRVDWRKECVRETHELGPLCFSRVCV